MSYNCPNCSRRIRVSSKFCDKCGVRLKNLHIAKVKENPEEKPKEFKVNEFVKLKLEKDITNIYVDNKKFTQCKYLLIEIPVKNIEDYDEVISIDDASERLGHTLEDTRHQLKIPVDVEFWGHCSNIQAWTENNYDTRLLHSNLAFPLLKKLTDVGDPTAKRVFKEEIAKRIDSGEKNVINYLIIENYFKYFNKEEYDIVIGSLKERVVAELEKKYKDILDPIELTALIDIIYENTDNPKILILELNKRKSGDTVVGFTIKKNRITKLNLIRCDLKILPDSIGYLTGLRELELIDNKLEHLPDSIGQLQKLKVLKLNGNKLEYLPDTIGNLISIEEIILDLNKIKKLPDTFANLLNLKHFSIYSNLFAKIPENIRELRNLRTIGVSNNSIERIPDSFTELKFLHTLDLSNNKLTELPEKMGNLKSLHHLWLNNNRIRKLPVSLISLKFLRNIYLSGNPIYFNLRTNKDDVLNELKRKGVNIW
jgi:Leucine-rich repeat (LRR) protein